MSASFHNFSVRFEWLTADDLFQPTRFIISSCCFNIVTSFVEHHFDYPLLSDLMHIEVFFLSYVFNVYTALDCLEFNSVLSLHHEQKFPPRSSSRR